MRTNELHQLAGEDDHAVFLRAAKGPFLCNHCEHYDNAAKTCDSKQLIRKIRESPSRYHLTVTGGKVQNIQAGDCCDFYDSI